MTDLQFGANMLVTKGGLFVFRVTIVPTKEVFRNEIPASVIWGCRVIGGDKIPKNKYNNISVTGKFALNLLLDEEYEVFLESTGNEKYPASYNIVGMVGFDYKEGKISVEPEVSYKALKKVTTSEKIANEILTHCPNFVEKVLNNEEGDIDYKPMHNVGPVRFAGYVRDIKSSYKSILLMSVFLEWNIPDNISARLDYPNKEKLVNALIENPYRVLIDEGSASFETADSIILEKDMSYANSKQRCLYAILDVLKGNEENGNTRINANTMVKVLRQVCPECSTNENILACVKESPYLYYDEKSKNVSIMATYEAEKTIADAIKSRLANNTPIPMAWESYRSVDGFEMTDEQAQILKNVCDYNVNILTGFAGGGKSLSTRGIVRMLEGHNKTYLLFSPTGIASKRLREVTGRHAQTIHRFLAQRSALECDFDELQYKDKISADFVIIDEYTTCDIKVLARLLTMLSDTTRIIFIGDNAQLASVGCGNLAEDLLTDNIIPTTRLTKVFRFGIGGIATVSTDVRNGKIPEEKSYDDYKHIVSSDPLKDVLKEYQSLLDKGYTKDEIMVLAPYNTSEIGTVHINSLIQDMVNPANGKKQEISFKGIRNLPITIREGDRVINTKNNYHVPLWEQVDEEGNPLETAIMNGDIGKVLQITKRGDTTVVVIQFDESIVYFDEDINKLLLAYCVTIHKIQGAQAKAVIVVIDICHKRLLSRNLLYVAYSRAQKYLVDICSNDVKEYALTIQENKQRDTWLKDLLRGDD